MPLAQLSTRAQLGIDAPSVRVEVHIANGLPAFTVVGLPETAVREARDRVRSAITNSGFDFPARRITVNLAPADLPKEGGRYDLAIALGILGASEQIDLSGVNDCDCYGELALSGELRCVAGLLPALIASRQAGRTAIIPAKNKSEAQLLGSSPSRLADSLRLVCASLNGGPALSTLQFEGMQPYCHYPLDMADVQGQFQARRALEVAAAGGHHMLMMGPPGTGKSMLAQRLNSILPPLSESEAMSTASIRSLCHRPINPKNWRQRPFQTPHHSVSDVALVGGGKMPRPGEISLAHNGVLFLDELTEFNRRAIEVLREPLEAGKIHISRASGQASFPARFQLIAALNPCPGGCNSVKECDCAPEQLRRYRGKLSTPFLDRIDIQIELARLPSKMLVSTNPEAPNSEEIRQRVCRARERQLQRQSCVNARLDNRMVEHHCRLDAKGQQLIQASIDKFRLSARSYHKLLKLSRSIADLGESDHIDSKHLAEAISLRACERLKD